MATLFYEPSTRTQLSFQAAALRLGAQVIGFSGTGGSSVTKGENLKDTVRTVANYVDAIVMRHPQEGAALAASLFSEVPVVNAGDGGHLHPTQTLTDLFTISLEKGRLSGLTVGICGDLLNGRTVHSLIKALVRFPGNRFVLISTPALRIPGYVRAVLQQTGTPFCEADTLEEAMGGLDILYMTRIQRERFESQQAYEREAGVYVLDAAKLALARQDLLVLHPLPRWTKSPTRPTQTPGANTLSRPETACSSAWRCCTRCCGRAGRRRRPRPPAPDAAPTPAA